MDSPFLGGQTYDKKRPADVLGVLTGIRQGRSDGKYPPGGLAGKKGLFYNKQVFMKKRG